MAEKKETTPEVAASAAPKRRARHWRIGHALVSLCAGLVAIGIVIVGAAVLFLTDREITAPGWLRADVAASIAEGAPDLTVTFGQMYLAFDRARAPRVGLRDAVIASANGEELFAVSELEMRMAYPPLLEGKVRPAQVFLSGIVAKLRRAQTGEVDLIATTTGAGVGRQAESLADLVGQVDELFLRTELAHLTDIEVNAVTLRFEDARAGRVWTVDGARMQMERDGDLVNLSGDLAILSGGADVATIAADFTTEVGGNTAQFGATVQDLSAEDLADFSPAFGWMTGLRAPLSGAVRGGVLSDGSLAPINATLNMSAGLLQPTPETRGVPFDAARTYFTFDPETNDLTFDEIYVDSAWGEALGDGRASLDGLEAGRLDQLVGQLRLRDVAFHPPGLYAEPLRLDAVDLDMRLVPEPFRLDIGQMHLLGQQSTIALRGGLQAAPDGWHAALDADMAAATTEQVLSLWPAGAVSKTRAWLQDNLLAGDLRDLQFALRSQPGSKPDIYIGFDFENTDLQYLKTFPPLENARGTASLYENRLVLDLAAGWVTPDAGGAIDVGGTSFIVPDVTVKGGALSVIKLQTDSSITAALGILDAEPLRLISNAGLPVDLADGRARADITFDIPLRQGVTGPEIIYRGAARLTDVVTTQLVEERTLSAADLALTVSPEVLTIAGDALFDDIPMTGQWVQPLGAAASNGSRFTADVELSARAEKTLNLGLPPGSVQGRGTGALVLDLPPGAPPGFTLTSDLRGVGLRIPEIGWAMSERAGGTLSVEGRLGEAPEITALSLDAPGLAARGAVRLRPDGGLEQAQFDRVRVAGWLDAPVTLAGRGAGAAPEVIVRGGTLDMRQAAFGSGGGSSDSGPLRIALDQLRITDTISLTGFRGDFDLRRGLQGSFSAQVNGAAAVSGQVEPTEGRSAFRIRSADAGAVFSAAGLLKQARGGDMSLTLTPVGTAGAFNGTLAVENTRIKDAPAVAALLNAVSVVGLLEQMGGQGLHFSEVDAAFRLTPERVTLTQAAAVGPSIGISMDGTYDVNAAQMDMQGVFSPIYLINGIGSVLTRRGEGLIGFNFRLRGPAESPNVQVNPLSALTPSFFREIFRRPPPKISAEPGETPGSAPQLQERDRSNRPATIATSSEDR